MSKVGCFSDNTIFVSFRAVSNQDSNMDVNESNPDMPEFLPTLGLATEIIQTASLVTGLIGFVGNILCYLTAARFKNQTSGTGFMKNLAVTEAFAAPLVPVQNLLIKGLNQLPGINSDFVCKIVRFVATATINSGLQNCFC